MLHLKLKPKVLQQIRGQFQFASRLDLLIDFVDVDRLRGSDYRVIRPTFCRFQNRRIHRLQFQLRAVIFIIVLRPCARRLRGRS